MHLQTFPCRPIRLCKRRSAFQPSCGDLAPADEQYVPRTAAIWLAEADPERVRPIASR